MRRGLVALCLLALGACTIADQQELPQVVRDPVSFEADIQPILGPGCGSLDCHGDRGRPLRLYAQFGRRAAAELRSAPLTPEEIADNVAALATMPPDRVLGKPLDVSAGGMRHVGGDLWPSDSAPAYTCVSAWLAGEQAQAACEMAAAQAPY